MWLCFLYLTQPYMSLYNYYPYFTNEKTKQEKLNCLKWTGIYSWAPDAIHGGPRTLRAHTCEVPIQACCMESPGQTVFLWSPVMPSAHLLSLFSLVSCVTALYRVCAMNAYWIESDDLATGAHSGIVNLRWNGHGGDSGDSKSLLPFSLISFLLSGFQDNWFFLFSSLFPPPCSPYPVPLCSGFLTSSFLFTENGHFSRILKIPQREMEEQFCWEAEENKFLVFLCHHILFLCSSVSLS